MSKSNGCQTDHYTMLLLAKTNAYDFDVVTTKA